MTEPADERYERVENGLAFLERNLEKLNEVLYEHQQQLSLLEKQIKEILEHLATAPGEIPDTKPPHY